MERLIITLEVVRLTFRTQRAPTPLCSKIQKYIIVATYYKMASRLAFLLLLGIFLAGVEVEAWRSLIADFGEPCGPGICNVEKNLVCSEAGVCDCRVDEVTGHLMQYIESLKKCVSILRGNGGGHGHRQHEGQGHEHHHQGKGSGSEHAHENEHEYKRKLWRKGLKSLDKDTPIENIILLILTKSGAPASSRRREPTSRWHGTHKLPHRRPVYGTAWSALPL